MYEKIGFVVSGRVQGVCFRAYTQEAAHKYDLTGWVRNRSDGKVEGEACGFKENIQAFTLWLKTKGSPYGRVDHLDLDEMGTQENRANSFDIRY